VKVLLAAYDKTSSGISSYTIEVANLLQKYAEIAIMSLEKISSPFRTIFIEPTKRYRAFPSEQSLLRPVVTIMMDINEEWITGRKYMNMEID